MLKRVVVCIELMREGVLGRDFFVNENIQVENYSLKVNDEELRRSTDPGQFGNICFLVAEITLKIANQFS